MPFGLLSEDGRGRGNGILPRVTASLGPENDGLPSEKREKEKRTVIVTDEILAGMKLIVSFE